MFTIREILKATKGTLRQGAPSLIVKGISINSKVLQPGELFLAVVGERHDAHTFIAQALAAGAVAVCVRADRKVTVPPGPAVIEVTDTHEALGRLARAHRLKFSIPVIAVTGSAGKTTTKEMVSCVLEARFRVLKNEGTLNNHFGVPLTLLKLNSDHQVMVIELGSNRPGDIRWLTWVCRPEVVIITNIGESHLALLRSAREVCREKWEIVRGISKEGTVILNHDDPWLRKQAQKLRGKKLVTFGLLEKNDYQAQEISIQTSRTISFRVNHRHPFTLKTPVAANVLNALAAVACGRCLGIPYTHLQRRLAGLVFQGNRQAIKRTSDYWIIDDTYNANPVSMRSALQTLGDLRRKGRKVLVCGDMLELGAQAPELHWEMGRLAAERGVDVVLTFGSLSRYLGEGARKTNPQVAAYHSLTRRRMHQRIQDICQPGDTILVKGSRGMQMELTVAFLQDQDVSEKNRQYN
jgi:UDP-N-acetylmuramoyl-tripeptide--D-alanyl-D-alanine ligase